MLLSLGIMLLFGSNWIQLSGAGALAVLTTAFVAAHGWTETGKVLSSSLQKGPTPFQKTVSR